MCVSALVIDDIPANIDMIQSFLRIHNINAMSASTGVEGFELGKQHQPDIILVDLRMPEPTWNGYKAIYELKQDPQTAHIPIIAVTAVGDEARARAAGCDDILFRPFRIGQLRNVISQYLPLTR